MSMNPSEQINPLLNKFSLLLLYMFCSQLTVSRKLVYFRKQAWKVNRGY